MSKEFKVLRPQDLELVGGLQQEFALDVLLGLSRTEKSLPSRYFYDDKGSHLFQQITELDEYYPTECERSIFLRHHETLSQMFGHQPFNLIDLGSGDGRKTNILLKEFLDRHLDFVYIPIDISEAAMREQVSKLDQIFPKLLVKGLVAEYFNGLLWHSQFDDRRNVVLFLGSNIGNFHRSEARAFLRSLWNFLKHDDLVIIGFDLKKDIDLMLRAYNDSRGVTSAFNLNLLERINHELGGHFKVDRFRHYATYDVFSGAMESYLVSLEKQDVVIEALNHRFEFQPFEPIHTEYSYKFLIEDIETLAADTGFTLETQLFDEKRYFVDSIWKVNKQV